MPPAPPHPPTVDEQAVLARVNELVTAGLPIDRASLPEIGTLFANHHGQILTACLRFSGNPELAAELCQETFLTAWKRLSTFRGESSFGTWLYGIAHLLSFNAVRKRGEVLTQDGVLDAQSEEASVLAQLGREERIELVRAAIEAALDPHEQEVAWLRYAEQLPRKQVASLLDLDGDDDARRILQRSRRKLRQELRRRLRELGHGSSFCREFWQ